MPEGVPTIVVVKDERHDLAFDYFIGFFLCLSDNYAYFASGSEVMKVEFPTPNDCFPSVWKPIFYTLIFDKDKNELVSLNETMGGKNLWYFTSGLTEYYKREYC